MRGFIVRLKDTKELVGFYFLPHIGWLGDTIDELTDPASCEYAEVESFGVVWECSGTPSFEIVPDSDEGDWVETEWDFGKMTLTDDGWSHMTQIEHDMNPKQAPPPIGGNTLDFHPIEPTEELMTWDYTGEHKD